MRDGRAGAGGQAVARETGPALEAQDRFLFRLVPAVEGFPRLRKFLLGDRIRTTALGVRESLVEATSTRRRGAHLARANLGVEKLRLLFRLVHDLRYDAGGHQRSRGASRRERHRPSEMGIAVRARGARCRPCRAALSSRVAAGTDRGGKAMAGMRVAAAAACAVLAAASAAGEEDCGNLRSCLHPMADKMARGLNAEAKAWSGSGPLKVRFRPARTEPAGVTVYCQALSTGLRNALHSEVRDIVREYDMDFEVHRAERAAVTPPEVVVTWTWDRKGDAREVLVLEAYYVLPDGQDGHFNGEIPAPVLSAGQRKCLFTFRPGIRWIEAGAGGMLMDEPTYRPDAWVADYEAGAKLQVLGRLEAAGGSGGDWSVVAWKDEEAGQRLNLFTMGLAVVVDDDTTGGGGVVVDPPPPPPDEFEVGDVFRDCPDCPEMVVVPAGSFTMGSPPSEEGRSDSEGPQHEVTIGSKFAVGVYEVTFDEWDACVSGGGCGGYRPDDEGWGRGGRPVINVSWEDARAYAEWLSGETGESYRLLSEAEWEYVARAGTVTRFWWGDAIGLNRANCDDSCGDHYANPSPVGSFGANAFGLHDVHGNVLEWVEDCWHENYARAPRDGSAWLGGQGGDCSLRVFRSGTWMSAPLFLRSAGRAGSESGLRLFLYGFRLFRSVRAFTP